MFYVYIVECCDKSLYCGYTSNLVARIEEHNTGKNGAKYTKNRRPVKLIYSEKLETKSQAMKREIQIKKLNRLQKLNLISLQ
jgi:putative endonuclease